MLLLWLLFATAHCATYDDTTLPSGMAEDTAHAPFVHGVASGDPHNDSVVIWTRRKPDTFVAGGTYELKWEVSTTDTMDAVVASGAVNAVEGADHTVNEIVEGLQPYTVYYYRFNDTSTGNLSIVGRTKTAFAHTEATKTLTIGLMTCPSVWSGYLWALKSMATALPDIIYHMGDTIYEYADKDEEFRMPTPCEALPDPMTTDSVPCFKEEPSTSRPTTDDHWAAIFRYTLLDTNYQLLRSKVPFFVIWDNHDINRNITGSTNMFLRYWPTRVDPETATATTLMNRHLSYGKVADLFHIDITKPEDENHYISAAQEDWLKENLLVSKADGVKFRVIGSQKPFSRMSPVAPSWLPDDLEDKLNALMEIGWDKKHYEDQRTIIINYLKDRMITDNLFLSGDMHMGLLFDVYDFDGNVLDGWPYEDYCPAAPDVWKCPCGPERNSYTHKESWGVEVGTPSVSRGNMDEAIDLALWEDVVIEFVVKCLHWANPHLRTILPNDHGWTKVQLIPVADGANDPRIKAQFFITDIKSETYPEDTPIDPAALSCADAAGNWWDDECVCAENIGETCEVCAAAFTVPHVLALLPTLLLLLFVVL